VYRNKVIKFCVLDAGVAIVSQHGLLQTLAGLQVQRYFVYPAQVWDLCVFRGPAESSENTLLFFCQKPCVFFPQGFQALTVLLEVPAQRLNPTNPVSRVYLI